MQDIYESHAGPGDEDTTALRRNQVSRLERLEARYRGDLFDGVSEFRLVWIERLDGTTPLPPGARIVREFAWQEEIENWSRPGLRFRFGTARERVVMGPDDKGLGCEGESEMPAPRRQLELKAGSVLARQVLGRGCELNVIPTDETVEKPPPAMCAGGPNCLNRRLRSPAIAHRQEDQL